jgi:hypothetical protein
MEENNASNNLRSKKWYTTTRSKTYGARFIQLLLPLLRSMYSEFDSDIVHPSIGPKLRELPQVGK